MITIWIYHQNIPANITNRSVFYPERHFTAKAQRRKGYTNDNFADASLNNIFALIIHRQKGEKEKAGAFLNKIQTATTAAHPFQRWVIAAAENDNVTLHSLNKNLNRNKYVDIMEKIIKL